MAILTFTLGFVLFCYLCFSIFESYSWFIFFFARLWLSKSCVVLHTTSATGIRKESWCQPLHCCWAVHSILYSRSPGPCIWLVVPRGMGVCFCFSFLSHILEITDLWSIFETDLRETWVSDVNFGWLSVMRGAVVHFLVLCLTFFY